MGVDPNEIIDQLENAEFDQLDEVMSEFDVEDLRTANELYKKWVDYQFRNPDEFPDCYDSRRKRVQLNSYIKKRLIRIFDATSTYYIGEVVEHRIRKAAGEGDIKELDRILDMTKWIRKELSSAWPWNIEEDRLEWSELLRARRLNEIQSKKAQPREKPGSCPICHGTTINRIMYGKPSFADRLYEPDFSDVTFGGCIIDGHMPNWHCTACNHQWVDPNNQETEEHNKELERFFNRLGHKNDFKPE